MRIMLNGEPRDVQSNNLAEVLIELDYRDSHIATALNGVFIQRDQRGSTPLGEGDRIEVLAPMQGG